MDVSSPEHGSASSEHDPDFSDDDGAGSGSSEDDDGAGPGSTPCWAKEVEDTTSEYNCEETVLMMCRRNGIREEDYRPLCAHGGRGPCRTPPETSNALCVFEAMLDAGVRFPLHKFYNKVLTHFGLAPSQLTPNAWRYLAGFVLLCEGVVGVRPMVAVFRHYFKLCPNGGNLQGFYHFEPYPNNHARSLFKINGKLPINYGWKKRFFFLESNKPWGCPKEWGTPVAEAYAKPQLTEAASTAMRKLDAEKAKRDIDLLHLLDKSRYQNNFPVLPPLPTPTQVKAEDSHGHDDAAAIAIATATTHPHPPKRMCLPPAPSPSPITGGSRGTPPRHLAVAMAPSSPPGFPPVPVGSSRVGDDDELSMSRIVCKMIQDGEAELRQQLRVEKAERARLENDVAQLRQKLETEKGKNIAEARQLTEELEAAKAEHAKTLAGLRDELKLLQASQAQLMTKLDLLAKEREAAESEHRLKVHNLMVDLKAEKEKYMAVDRQFRDELQAAQGQVWQLQEAHAAEMNTVWLLSVRYMRDLALMVCPDADHAHLTAEALITTAATSVQAASPLQAPVAVDVDHQ